MSSLNGLGDLQAKRARQVRKPPPPRHAKKEVTSESAESLPEAADLAPEATKLSEAPKAKPAPKRKQSEDQGPVKSVQLYLDAEGDEYLHQVRLEAVTERKSISSSAVVRFALRRLMDSMTAAEVVAALDSEAPAGKRGKGRPRL